MPTWTAPGLSRSERDALAAILAVDWSGGSMAVAVEAMRQDATPRASADAETDGADRGGQQAVLFAGGAGRKTRRR